MLLACLVGSQGAKGTTRTLPAGSLVGAPIQELLAAQDGDGGSNVAAVTAAAWEVRA